LRVNLPTPQTSRFTKLEGKLLTPDLLGASTFTAFKNWSGPMSKDFPILAINLVN